MICPDLTTKQRLALRGLLLHSKRCLVPLMRQLVSAYVYHSGKKLGDYFNLLKPTGYVMYQQFNIQQLYALPTVYLCVLYLSENKQRLVHCAVRTGSLNKAVCASSLEG